MLIVSASTFNMDNIFQLSIIDNKKNGWFHLMAYHSMTLSDCDVIKTYNTFDEAKSDLIKIGMAYHNRERLVILG